MDMNFASPFSRQSIVNFLKSLRDQIIDHFETLEPSRHRFERKHWQHTSGGGGEISLIRGDVFEKAAVNWSGVSGAHFPTDESSGPFFATGISIITHMQNPHSPTVHMNIRYIETEKKWWFGGGYDLTPMGFAYPEDTTHFHKIAKDSLDSVNGELYAKFSQNAREYFYIPHWKKERGVGGVFFDHYRTDDPVNDLKMWQTLGSDFPKAIMPIYQKRCLQSYSEEEKNLQQKMRAHYAEFNLLYDRGTRFGFLSGGNPEAILCSMPPCACW